ncbi:MAG: radical SAM protein [Patescibacteria group bacterium]
MKILLITPDYFCENIWDRFLKSLQLGLSPVLGLGYVAAAAEKAGHEVKILDMAAQPTTRKNLALLLRQYEPDLIGFNLTNLTIDRGVLVAKFCKNIQPHTVIAVGGPAAEILPEATLAHACFDLGLRGEADFTFVELLDYLSGKRKEKPEGLIVRENGGINFYGEPALILNLDEIPFPARHLFKGQYMHIAARKKPFASMMTSRGCPYRCGFCSKVPNWCRLRAMSAGKVVEEFRTLSKQGIKEVNLYDDTFTCQRQRTLDICQGLIEAKFDLIWAARTRLDSIDEELLKKMKEAGCYRLHLGIESGSDEILKKMNKMITREQIIKGMKLIKSFGYETVGYFLLGYPGETVATMEETRQLIKEIPLDYIELNTFHPLPDSPVYQEMLAQGVEKVKNEWYDYMALKRKTLPVYHGDGVTPEQVEKYFYKIFREYYFSPRRIINFLRLINTGLRFKNYLRGFTRVILLYLTKSIYSFRKNEKIQEPSLKI